MDRHLWTRVKTVAADAWDRPAEHRATYVATVCAGEEALAREVLSLLGAMEDVGGRFETPALAMPDAHLAATQTLDAEGTTWIGERIGAWTLVREIGHGGMGTVYLAERADAEFTQRAAIKVVRGVAHDHRLVERFREERRILAALEHPHIARLIDGGATALGLPYVVMEYVDGMPIDVFCEQRALGLRDRLALFQRVCEAAHYAHQRLIVHRDIKSSNILVTADGIPKLLDFGIAKILETDTPADATLLRLVTPESASPEQIRGEPITTASDVYALGVLLYRLVTGAGPYRLASTSEIELMQAVCDQAPSAPSTIVKTLDADLDRIVLKALRKEPARRYGGADHFSDDLQRYLDGRPVAAAPDSHVYRARKFVARHRIAVAAAAALAIAVAGGTAATLWQAREARKARARAERQFNAVRTLASSVLGELHDTVNSLPGSTAARELLLRRATEYLDDLSREAGTDAALRRELAAGYRRLAEVQGVPGLSNLGNPEAALASYRKAIAQLESLVADPADPGDRLTLIRTYVVAAAIEKNPEVRRSENLRAVALLDALPPAERASSKARDVAVAVWYYVGRERLDAKDYEGAKQAFRNNVHEAETVAAGAPDDPRALGNVSAGYKQLGTAVHLEAKVDEAIGYYRQALALDSRRVPLTHDAVEARLDLSFSHGAVAGALTDKHDLDAAREEYLQAIALRRAIAEADPANDRAFRGLVFGYQALSKVEMLANNPVRVFELRDQALTLLRDHATSHPTRDAVWKDFAAQLFDTSRRCDEFLESSALPDSERRRYAARVDAWLAELSELRDRWAREHPPGTLPPSDDDLRQIVEQTRRLAATARAPRASSR